ncbi:CoA-transferase [Pandoraea horticolens]|uniref:CoA-transferase n=1 Tax=Pandoraea horticolens TaxID=2508298 RepID=A0A5E4X4G2_9BURK|nr:CoA-transferase [Pandoraea horticolens]
MGLDGQAHWRAICALVHRVDLLDDPRFANARERARHRAALRDVLEAVFVLEDRGVWSARQHAGCSGRETGEKSLILFIFR